MRIFIEVDKVFAKVGDELRYTIQLENQEESPIHNVIVMNQMPQGLLLNEKNSSKGIYIGTMEPREIRKVTYTGVVSHIPVSHTIINRVEVGYSVQEEQQKKELSNTVLTLVNDPMIGVVEGTIELGTNKQYVDRGEVLISTLKIQNKGNIEAKNIVISNIIPKGMEGIATDGDVIYLESIGAGEVRSITYEVRAPLEPLHYEILSEVELAYTFQLPDQTVIERKCSSNPVKAFIYTAYFGQEGLSKEVSRTNVTLGDRVSYAIKLKNKGNIPAYGIRLQEEVTKGIEWVPGSLRVNQMLRHEDLISSGLVIEELKAQEEVEINYELYVPETSLPTNPIKSKTMLYYAYQQDGIRIESVEESEEIDIWIEAAMIDVEAGGLEVMGPKEYVSVGDEIEYIIYLHNTGNVAIQSIQIVGQIPIGVHLITDSWKVMGEHVLLELGQEILPGATWSMPLKFKIQEIPLEGKIEQQFMFNYRYLVGGEQTAREGLMSPKLTTYVQWVKLIEAQGLFKQVNQAHAQIGDALKYQIYIMNEGNQLAQNVVWTENLPDEVEIVPQSVRINGEMTEIVMEQGILLGELVPGQQWLLEYDIKILGMPKGGKLEPLTTIYYSYLVGQEEFRQESSISQMAKTQVEMAMLLESQGGFTKQISKQIVSFGETVRYDITLENKGNVSAKEIELLEVNNKEETVYKIPEILPGQRKEITYEIPANGIETGDTLKSQSFIRYKYNVGTQVKEIAQAMQEYITHIREAYISPEAGGITHQVDQAYAKVGDTLNYTLVITNQGNVEANWLGVQLPEVEGGEWIRENLRVNNQKIAYTDQGIAIENLSVGEKVKIEYSLGIYSLPQNGNLKVSPMITYEFLIGEEEIRTRQNQAPAAYTQVNFTTLQEVDGAVVRSITPDQIALGEVVTYQIQLTNRGNTQAKEVVVHEILSEGVQYVEGSFEIDGKAVENIEINEGIILGDLEPYESKNLLYQVKVVDQSTQSILSITDYVTYQYVFSPEYPAQEVTYYTESKIIPIYDTQMSDTQILEMGVDKLYADVGEYLTYQITVENKGNVVMQNPVYSLAIPRGLVWEQGNLWIDGEMGKVETLQNIPLQEIAIGESKVIILRVRVVSAPIGYKVALEGQLTHYFIKPNGAQIDRTILYKSEQTSINTAGMLGAEDFKTEVNSKNLHDQEEVTFQWTLTNTGNRWMEQTYLAIEQTEEVLAYESVQVNGVQGDGNHLIVIGEVAPGETKFIAVKARVKQIPRSGKVTCIAKANYKYEVQPGLPLKQKTDSSRPINLWIQDTGLRQKGSSQLTVDKSYVQLDEVLTYDFILRNSGNVIAENVQIMPVGLEEDIYVYEALQIADDISYTGDLVKGILLEKIEIDQQVHIRFSIKVVNLSVKGEIHLAMNILYRYTDAKEQTIWGEVTTDTVKVPIKSADFRGINFTKVVDQEEIKIGEKVTYTIQLKNAGNVSAQRAVLHQQSADGMTLIPESVRINNQSMINQSQIQEIRLGEIGIGEEIEVVFEAEARERIIQQESMDITYISYQMQLETDDIREARTEAIQIPIVIKSPIIQMSLKADKCRAIVGEEIRYQLAIKNEGNQIAQKIGFTSLIPEEFRFTPRSLMIGTTKISSVHTVEQIRIDELRPGEESVLSFLAYPILKNQQGMSASQVEARYEFCLRDILQVEKARGSSQVISIEEVKLEIQKKSDKEKIKLKIGDEISYLVKLTNEGSIPLSHIIFYEHLPEGTALVQGSFRVGDKSLGVIRPEDGINIGMLDVMQSVDITYRIRVIDYYSNKIQSKAYATYMFKEHEEEAFRKKQTEVVCSENRVISPNLLEVVQEHLVMIPYYLADIEKIAKVEIKLEVLEVRPLRGEQKKVAMKGMISSTISYIDSHKERQEIQANKLFMQEIELVRKMEEAVEIDLQLEKYHYGIINPRELMIWVKMSLSEG